jgi:hypothetical protein
MSGWKSLEKSLDGMFGRLLKELPTEQLRLDAAAAVAPALWDKLTPELRRESCVAWDNAAREFSLRAKIKDLEREVEKERLKASHSLTEDQIKEQRIKAFETDRDRLKDELAGTGSKGAASGTALPETDVHDASSETGQVRPTAPVARPTRTRPARERALAAINQVYSSGVPSQAQEPNGMLIKKVSDALKADPRNRKLDLSPDTILRAAGRRK